MKMYVKSENEIFSNDPFLPVQHSIDKAMQEADKATNYFKSQGDHMPESLMREISEDCYKLQYRIRKAKTIYYSDKLYNDTLETMLEDQSRYLED